MQRERSVGMVKGFVSPKVLGNNNSPVAETFSIGSAGTHVTNFQKMLYDLDYNIVVDGDFGNQTSKVVKQFQKDNQLIQDGIVTPALLGLLQQSLSKKAALIQN